MGETDVQGNVFLQADKIRFKNVFKTNFVYTDRSCKPSFLRNWMQGVVDRGVKSLKNSEDEVWKSVRLTRSGPAITLDQLMICDDQKVSIDLVPIVLPNKNTETPLIGNEFKDITFGEPDPKFHLVPVPPRVGKDFKPNVPQSLFRGTFPTFEERLLEDQGTLKDLIRILKVL